MDVRKWRVISNNLVLRSNQPSIDLPGSSRMVNIAAFLDREVIAVNGENLSAV
jgi:hypothetical protein